MRNHEAILDRLVEGDGSDDLTMAALDSIREDTGESLLSAVLRIAECVRYKAQARDLALAADLLSVHSPHRAAVRAMILNTAPVEDHPSGVIYLVPGSGSPFRCSQREGLYDGGGLPTVAVSVGASWVVESWGRTLSAAPRPNRRLRFFR